MTANFLVLPASASTGFRGGEGIPSILSRDNDDGIALSTDGHILICRVRWFGSRSVYTAINLETDPLPFFSVDGTVFKAQINRSFDGFPVFKAGGNYIFNTDADGWVYMPDAFKAPVEWQYSGSSIWGGDSWYSLSVKAGGGYETSVEVTRRGTNRNSNAALPEITLRWPRWEKIYGTGDGLFGKYEPVGQSGPNILFGSPQFNSVLGTWVGRPDHTYACREAGLVLAYAAGGVWKTGPISPGSSYHYRATREPSAGSGAMLLPYTGDGDQVTDVEGVALTYAGLGPSGQTTTVRMAEVAQWL